MSENSHNLEKIKNFIYYLEKFPFVIGSRYILGGKNCMKGWRLLLSIWGNKVIHQKCLMHLNKLIVKEFGKHGMLLDEYNKYLLRKRGWL